MALAKDQIPHDSSMGSKVQSCVFKENSAIHITSLRAKNGVVNEYHNSVLEDEDGSQSTNGYSNDSAITHSPPPPPLCGNNGNAYKNTNYQIEEEEEESLINFKAGLSNNIMQGSSESLLSFQKNMKDHNANIHKEYCVWDNIHNNYWNQISPRSTSEMHLVQDLTSFHQTATTSSYNSTIVMNNAKEKQHSQSLPYGGWLYSEQIVPASDSIKQSSSGAQESVLMKRRNSMNMKAAKKQCSTESKTPKPKSEPSKDPQSVAAKNRRERISERLKILQELVPNGSKVDLVTMLEKAISYVKFLQLQVKVLATDEFWPVQGGKAPDISQVKEAIDAILSAQRDRTSTSK